MAQQTINKYFAISFREDKQKNKELHDLQLKLLEKIIADEKYFVPNDASSVVLRKYDYGHETLQTIGTSAFKRLEKYYERDFVSNKISKDEEEQLNALDKIIHHLPSFVIKEHLADYNKIIKNRELRKSLDYSMQNIGDFGDDGKEMIFYILEDIAIFAEDPKNKYLVDSHNSVLENVGYAFCKLAKLGDFETRTKFEKFADYHLSMQDSVGVGLLRNDKYKIGMVKLGMNEGDFKTLFRIKDEPGKNKRFSDFNETYEQAQKNNCD